MKQELRQKKCLDSTEYIVDEDNCFGRIKPYSFEPDKKKRKLVELEYESSGQPNFIKFP